MRKIIDYESAMLSLIIIYGAKIFSSIFFRISRKHKFHIVNKSFYWRCFGKSPTNYCIRQPIPRGVMKSPSAVWTEGLNPYHQALPSLKSNIYNPLKSDGIHLCDNTFLCLSPYNSFWIISINLIFAEFIIPHSFNNCNTKSRLYFEVNPKV